MPPSLDFDDLTLDNRPQAGVLGALVASDLRAGRFTLQFGPADPTVSATLAGWSMSIGAHVFRSTDTPKSGPQLTSTLRATGDPGLTAGVGGTITLRTDRVSLQPGSSIVTSTLGLDRAGDVAIEAGRIDLTSAAIRSTTAAPGDAGRIELTARQNLTARDSIIEVSAANATGGDVSLTAGSALRLSGTTVNAASGADGGNITLQAGRLILITNQSTVTAQAAGDGGRILLDPPIVVLSNSVINGLSQGMPVQVQIIADNFFKSDSQILTNTQLDFPQTDVSGALITLQAARLTREAQLAADCGLRLGESVSSFIVVGRGAQPPEPGGLSPAIDPHDFNLQNRPPRQ
jgi:hypothetical protein